MSRRTSISWSMPRRPRRRELQVVRSELLELAGADAHHLPPGAPQRAVLAAIDVFAFSDVLEPEPAGTVVLDGDAQFRQEDVGPHLEVIEERPAHADGVEPLGDVESCEEVRAQLRLDGGSGARGALADERLPLREVGGLRADRPGLRRRAAVRGRSAGRIRGGFASIAHSGHHADLRRSRPGRSRCSLGVAANRCPASHCQSSSTSAAGGTCVSVMPALSSGWYWRISIGKGAQASR